MAPPIRPFWAHLSPSGPFVPVLVQNGESAHRSRVDGLWKHLRASVARHDLPTVRGDLTLDGHRRTAHEVIRPLLVPLRVELGLRDDPHRLLWVRNVRVRDMDVLVLVHVENQARVRPFAPFRVPSDQHGRARIRPRLQLLEGAGRGERPAHPVVLRARESLLPRRAPHGLSAHHLVDRVLVAVPLIVALERHREARRHAGILAALTDGGDVGLC